MRVAFALRIRAAGMMSALVFRAGVCNFNFAAFIFRNVCKRKFRAHISPVAAVCAHFNSVAKAECAFAFQHKFIFKVFVAAARQFFKPDKPFNGVVKFDTATGSQKNISFLVVYVLRCM